MTLDKILQIDDKAFRTPYNSLEQLPKIATLNLPIIFLSACAEPNHYHFAYAGGGDEYLVKPLNIEQLQTTLGKYFGEILPIRH